MKDTILVPVKASEELPEKANKQLSVCVKDIQFRDVEYDFLHKKWFDKHYPNRVVLVDYWYKETTKSELVREELEKRMPSDIIHEREALIKAFDDIRKCFTGRSWLMDGRGAYPYDDEKYKEEVRCLMDEFEAISTTLWKNIKSKSFEYKEAIWAEIEAEMPSGDLKQYMTNLLYYARGEIDYMDNRKFDKWVEVSINGIDEYFKSLQPKEEDK